MKITSKHINYTVNTVDDLLTLTGEEDATVVVTDENRGGTFVYRSANVGSDDSGTKFNGWTRQYDGAVNVRWFSLDTLDASVAINKASLVYDSILLPKGEITIKSPINLRSGLSIRGVSMDGTKILRDITVPTFDMFYGESLTKIELNDFTIDGVQLEDVNIVANRFSGIRVSGTSNSDIFINRVTIIRTTSGEAQVEGNRGAITLENVYNASVKNCYAIYNRATVCATFGATNYVTYEGNNFYGESGVAANTGDIGSLISGQGDNINVINNICIAGGYSNISVNGKNCTVVGNLSKGSLFSGINIGHHNTDSRADNTVVTGNVVSNNLLDGISTAGSSNVIIGSNTVYNNTRDGIATLYDSSFVGSVENVSIINNIIYDNSVGVMLAYGTDLSVRGNTIHDNSSSGVYIEYGNLTSDLVYGLVDVNITDNEIKNNGGLASSGIAGETSNYTRSFKALNNILESDGASQGNGITVAGTNLTCKIRDNVLSGHVTNLNKLSGGTVEFLLNPLDSELHPSFINGFSSQSNQSVTYRKDSDGFVHIQGAVTGGSLNGSAFVLPVGYRPEVSQYLATQANGAFARTTVSTTGNVYIYDSATNHSLAGIVFKATGA